MHTKINMNIPADILQYLLKILSMFKIRLWYDDSIVHEDAPDADRIMYINCGKTVGFSLENQPIEDFITFFVTNAVVVVVYWPPVREV